MDEQIKYPHLHGRRIVWVLNENTRAISRVTMAEARRAGDTIIECHRCGEPAREIDEHYPNCALGNWCRNRGCG